MRSMRALPRLATASGVALALLVPAGGQAMAGATAQPAATTTNRAAPAHAARPAAGPRAAVVPGQPTNVVAVAGKRAATITWKTPATTGGAPITSYIVTGNPGGSATVTGYQNSARIGGLTAGTAYTFVVRARNRVGTGPASAASGAVTPVPATAPDAPLAVIAVPGPAGAWVTWRAPVDNGGDPINHYQITAQPGGVIVNVGGAKRVASVTGLANGTRYTFAVRAFSDKGGSTPSDSSGGITAGDALTGAIAGGATAGDWPQYTADNLGSDNNPAETQIGLASAPTVHVRASYQTAGPIDAQPTVVGSQVFVGDMAGYMHAVTTDMQPLWTTYLGTTGPNATCPGGVVYGIDSSATYAVIGSRPVVYVGGGDSALYALDATTGDVIWRSQLAPSPNNFLFTSPLLVGGSLYEGVASFSDCPLTPGKLIKLDALTGVVQGSLTVSPDGCLGGGIWGSPTIDAEGHIFVSTGTEAACPTAPVFEASLIEVDPVTMQLIDYWHIPESQQADDGDFGSVPTIFDTPIQGTSGHLVGIANKNGVFYVFDRDALGAGPVWQAQIARSTGDPFSGGSIAPAAWDGQRLYVGGSNVTINGTACGSSIHAFDPATGTVLWQTCFAGGPLLGPVVVANGVVIANTGHSTVVLNAATGGTKYHFSVWNTFFSGPSIAHGTIYTGNRNGLLYALSPQS